MKSYLKIAAMVVSSLIVIYVGFELTGLASEFLAAAFGPYAPLLVLSSLLGIRGVVWVIDRADKKNRETIIPAGATYMALAYKSLP
jgi:hypothetical protein